MDVLIDCWLARERGERKRVFTCYLVYARVRVIDANMGALNRANSQLSHLYQKESGSTQKMIRGRCR